MRRRFVVGLLLSLPVVALEMAGYVPGLGLGVVSPRIGIWLQFALASPVVLWAGWPLLQRGARSFATGRLNMFSLIGLGVGVAYLFSLVAAFLPAIFPPAFQGADRMVPVYFEASAVSTVLVLLGQVLELRARERTGSALRALLNLAPKTARRLVADGHDEEIPVAEVQAGDRLRIRPGDAVPVDGEVVEGRTSALGLATPMSIMVGVGRGAQAGVLIKSAEALERFEKVNTLVVDKTGTLTEGRPRVTRVRAVLGASEDELLALAAGLERSSEHPLAAAIVAAAPERGLTIKDAGDFTSVTGKGVIGTVDGRRVILGNAKLLADEKVPIESLDAPAEEMRQEGATVLLVAVDDEAWGMVAVADPVKASTPAALASLRESGLRIVMLTGDNRTTALAVARRLGIADVQAEVLPEDKYQVVRRLKQEGSVVAMAGDGVNDAPALAEADVGVAMGTGTEVAMQSAGVILVKGDLAGIARARVLSRATMGNIRQNLFPAFVYNALGVPIAAGVFYPVFGWRLSPVIAAAAMTLSSVSVIGNALRLRWVKLA